MVPARSIRIPDKNNGEAKFNKYLPIGKDVAKRACKTIINVIIFVPVNMIYTILIIISVTINLKLVYRTNQKRGKVMKSFRLKKTVQYCLRFYIVLYTMITFGMENSDKKLSIICNNFSLKPEKIITIFNPKKELEIGRLWYEVIPGNIMITPDDKGVVIGVRGQVLYSSFDKTDDRDPELIIEHPRVTHSPMITMAKRRDGSLLIVSAGNYINSEKKAVAEYIIYSSSHGYSKLHKLDWPIQAISVDSLGETLAIAGLHAVKVIDCVINKTDMASFKKRFGSENWIIDIAMNPEGNAVVAVGNEKSEAIQWMMLTKVENKVDVQNLKQIDSKDSIEKIYYPSSQEIFYVTRDGKAKIVDVYDVLENTGEELKAVSFFDLSVHAPLYDMVVGDPSEHVATAHWTNNLRLSEEIRKKIEVYCKDKNNNYIQKFILEIPALEERYVYVTPLGQQASGIGHLLNVALRARHVVALASDGKMRLWQLPENLLSEQFKNREEDCSEKKIAEDRLVALKALSQREVRRNDSSSGNSNFKKFSISAPADEGKRKQSPRVTGVKNGSRENSPASSRDDSPVRTKPSPKISSQRTSKEDKT